MIWGWFWVVLGVFWGGLGVWDYAGFNKWSGAKGGGQKVERRRNVAQEVAALPRWWCVGQAVKGCCAEGC